MSSHRKFFSLFVFLTVIFLSGCIEPVSKKATASEELTSDLLFTLKDPNGSEVRLEKLLGEKKAVLLNFWATWCPPCREEIPGLIKLQEAYKDTSFTILGIDVDESPKKVAAFIEKTKLNYPVVIDVETRVAERYGVVGIPTSILVTSDKKIVGVYSGFTNELVRDVEKVLLSTSS